MRHDAAHMPLTRRVSHPSAKSSPGCTSNPVLSTGTIYPVFGAGPKVVVRAESAVEGAGSWYAVPGTAGELIAVLQPSVYQAVSRD
jgi:hypothetical protein